MSKNVRNINEVFGKNAVVAPEPDTSWPLANEYIGIEIEVEDFGGLAHLVVPEWTTHSDGSLRNGIEFVLSSPTAGTRLTQAINKFFDAGFTYNMSERTSVHIHINASDNMTFDQFRNMFIIMYLIEPAVFRWADENRKWCGYCSPLTDLSPARLVPLLTDNSADARRFIQAVQGGGNSDRYYGYNMAAFARHGTVEFRYFPCTNVKQDVINWVRFVMEVKKTARKFETPEDILRACDTGDKIAQFIEGNFSEPSLMRNLDVAETISRVHDLLATMQVVPTAFDRAANYRVTTSKGIAKLISVTFPNHAAPEPVANKKSKDPSELYAEFLRMAQVSQQVSAATTASAPVWTTSALSDEIFSSPPPRPARPRR